MFFKKFQTKERFATEFALGGTETREFLADLLEFLAFFELDQFF